MPRVALAISVENNMLGAASLEKLKQLAPQLKDLHLFVYLHRMPPEMLQLPLVTDELVDWKAESLKVRDEIGDALKIPTDNRHFVDDIIGDDEVFRDARNLNIEIIVTEDPTQLEERTLTDLFNHLEALYKGTKVKTVIVEDAKTYIEEKKSELKSAKPREEEGPSQGPEHFPPPISQPGKNKTSTPENKGVEQVQDRTYKPK